ncbi:MAG: acetate--CoA ligase family protein [Rhodospirillales bacterium]|nr:acetate--CoA ligase family protein [Rhodospirillales bacterium]
MTRGALNFLAPRSIAVIGASRDPTKRGYQALRYLIADNFPGGIFPIHPKEPEILGIPAYPSVAAVPEPIDLALVCTPARTLPALMEDLGAKGVRGAIVVAGGFAEAGDEGARIQAEMLAAARRHGVRIIGPNTSGVFNLPCRMNLVGMPDVRPGGLGIVSQSGNMALSIVTEATAGGHLGFSTYVGVGNQVDVRFNEYLRYLGDDPATDVAILYVEGFRHGRTFLEVARDVTQRKPVVVYKSGRSEAGQASARSHTGAMAGSYAMTADLLRQAGITVAAQADHVVPLAESLSLLPPPASNRVAILADGGGHATIAADAMVEAGIAMPPLSNDTRARLAALLPPAASLVNPVDVAGGTDSNPGVFADCAAAILEDPSIDALLIVGLFGGYKLRFAASLGPIENETAIRLGALLRRFGKPILLQSLYAPVKPEALQILRGAGVPVHHSVETAVTCLAGLIDRGAARRRNAAEAPPAKAEPPADAAAIIVRCRDAGRRSLLEPEAIDLLTLHGIATPPYVLARSEDDLAAATAAFGAQPKAMKIVSPDILHKTEAGGVRLTLRHEDTLREAFRDIVDASRRYKPDARVTGVLVTPMAAPGIEVIIGVTDDPIFGPVMMFGLGGTFVEVLKDVTFRAIPLTPADAAEMLDGIQAKRILDGVRGAPPVDRAALVDLMVKISSLIQSHPEIAELDLNPVFAHPAGLTIADTRIILRDQGNGVQG